MLTIGGLPSPDEANNVIAPNINKASSQCLSAFLFFLLSFFALLSSKK